MTAVRIEELRKVFGTFQALDGLSLTCTNGPAITLLSTNRCFVVLAPGTANSLVDNATYTQTGEGTLHGTGPLILFCGGSVVAADFAQTCPGGI